LKIADIGVGVVATSIIVAAELRYGAAKRKWRRLTAQLIAVLEGLPIIPFESPADEAYGDVRAALEPAGAPIGGNDLLIASQALSLGMTLVTNNEREFARVNGLSIENWLR
jgi:tRNA(fMet)-specific endonuclease VapC